MGLETATYISQLVPANPLSTDAVSQGDDHLRLIKSVLQSSFPAMSSPFRKWRTEAVSANETVTTDDDGTLYLMDASGGARTVALPAAATTGIVIGVKKVDSSLNAVTVDANSTELIDGALTAVVRSQYDVQWFISNGTGWNLFARVQGTSLASGNLIKARACANTNVNLTTGLVPGQLIDGVTLVQGDIVLLIGQTSAPANGLYIVPASGTASRAPNFDTWASLVGSVVVVIEGTDRPDTVWRAKQGIAGTLGTNDIVYTQLLSIDDFTSIEPDLSRDDYVLGVNGATGKTVLMDIGDFPGVRQIHVRDQKASGTSGGTLSSGTWNVRTLNTVVDNSITGASLASNRITLPSGTYDLDATLPAGRNGTDSGYSAKAAVYNVTDSAFLLIGGSAYTDASSQSGGSFDTRVRGRFTLTATKDIDIRHYIQGSGVSGGLDMGTGQVEVYTEVIIKKVE